MALSRMEEWEWHQVKKYFRKIINSFVLGLLWIFAMMTSGLYYKLGFVDARWRWHNTVFYGLLFLSLAGLLWFYYKTWKNFK